MCLVWAVLLVALLGAVDAGAKKKKNAAKNRRENVQAQQPEPTGATATTGTVNYDDDLNYDNYDEEDYNEPVGKLTHREISSLFCRATKPKSK